LSHAQQRLWFLHQLEPRDSSYNLPTVLHLEGELNAQALREALTLLVARHEILRTVYLPADPQPLQVPLPPEPVPLAVEELGQLHEDVRFEVALERARSFAAEPFSLGRGPLTRALLLRLAPASHVLIWVVHHIATDGWSEVLL